MNALWPSASSNKAQSPFWSRFADLSFTIGSGPRAIAASPRGKTRKDSVATWTESDPSAWNLIGCCALECKTFFVPGATPRHQFPTGLLARYLPGCFDDFLKRLDAGKASVNLLINHDEQEVFCRTEDGLRFWMVGGSLMFGLFPKTARGHWAIRTLKARAMREASVYSHFVDGDLIRSNSGGIPEARISQATFSEVSLVKKGACPGTWARFVRATRPR